MQLRYRPLTLLEVVIGFALTAILLAFLFTSFRHIATLSLKVQKARETTHNRALVQLRVTQLLDHLMYDEEKFSLRTGAYPESFSDALYLIFDNGIDHNPQFCGTLQAILYLNTNKQLCLTLKSKHAERKEILLTPVSTFSCKFFNSQSKNWQNSWEQKAIPALLVLQLDKTAFTFLIPENG